MRFNGVSTGVGGEQDRWLSPVAFGAGPENTDDNEGEVKMTEQERQMITGLADRMRSAPAPQIDRDADELIRSTIGGRPDALYVLTQTVLIQDMALKQAQAQIEALKQQGAEVPGEPQGNFLPQSGYAQSRYSAPPAQQAPQPVVYEEPVPRRSGFSDFLHNAATTAAGVIAGEIAFDSLASIFGHRGGYGGGFFSGGGIMPGGETIVNNYYGDQGSGVDRGGDSRFADEAAASGDDLSPDIEDDRDQSGDDFMGDDSSDSSGDDFSGGDSGGDSGF